MFKQHTSKTRFSQTEDKSSRRSQKMIESCENVIKELQFQLEYALQQNQQKDQIIKLLTEQKQFYEQQSRKSDQRMYPKLKQQLNFNQSLVNGLKQYNKELTEKNLILEQENKDLWEKCHQKDQVIRMTELNIIKLQQEKSKLQREWGQTLKCVKRKIFEIQQDQYTIQKPANQKEINKRRELSRGGQKKSSNPKQQMRKNSINQLTNKDKNYSKVQQILNQIDQKLLNYDFLDMIQSKQLRKQIKNYDISETNKQNFSGNINLKLSDLNQLKQKKVPILKLSQLTLKEDFV